MRIAILAVTLVGCRVPEPSSQYRRTTRIRIIQRSACGFGDQLDVELFPNGEFVVETEKARRDTRIPQTRAQDLFQRLALARFFTIAEPSEACRVWSDEGSATLTVVDGDHSRAISLSDGTWACPQLEPVRQVMDEITSLVSDMLGHDSTTI
jgi:hypothetical protein